MLISFWALFLNESSVTFTLHFESFDLLCQVKDIQGKKYAKNVTKIRECQVVLCISIKIYAAPNEKLANDSVIFYLFFFLRCEKISS